MAKVKVKVKWNSKLFDVLTLNDECQNDQNVKLFDAGHSNVKYQ